jgi:glycerol kinase
VPHPGLVVAVDIATTGVKAAAVDAAGVSHGAVVREYPTESPRPGWAVQDPDVVAGSSAAVEGLDAWRIDPTPDDVTSALAEQASEEEMP